MARAASRGMTPASACASASARSKSSMARTNASADSACVNASRAKLRPTMVMAARALELDEDRFACSPEPDVPAVALRIAGITSRDQGPQPVGVADGASQWIVLDRVDRGEEHPSANGPQEPAREAGPAELRPLPPGPGSRE